MHMNKKSQGLSINVIIIVAIALIVLVVLIAIFTGRIGGFVGGVEAAGSCNDICVGIGKDGGSIHVPADTDLPATAGAVDKEGNACICKDKE